MSIKSLLKKIVGSQHEREVKKLQPLVDEINELCDEFAALSDEELRAKTAEFRAYIAERVGPVEEQIRELRHDKAQSSSIAERVTLAVQIQELEVQLNDTLQEALEELLPEAFAAVKSACKRLVGQEVVVTGQKLVWDMVPYDVQLVGAIALHRGTATEMATGEGKTLVATMPLYLNALSGRGAHLITVNSYLAERDAQWMGNVYRFLGMEVGVIDLYQPGTEERRAAYAPDITSRTNN
jgi:preprotein translocase subunit SecA